MAAPAIAGLPPNFTLANGYTVRVTAQDPTTGATVTSVIASGVSIDVDPVDGSGGADLPVDMPWLVPVGS